MGKIRVKALGIEDLEKQQAKDAKKRKVAKDAKKFAKAPGMKGGEKLVSMAPTEEELEKMTTADSLQTTAVDGSPKAESEQTDNKVKTKTKTSKVKTKARQRSKRYRDALIQVDRNRRYPLSEAVALLKKLEGTKFDATVELHINTTEKGINGQVTLPHGSGKKIQVSIADPENKDFDDLVKKIEGGTIDFDVLIATPAAMPKLTKVAKILGPRGLMPNPKSGTITDKPEGLALSFAKGQTNFRTESQAPLIHARIGKVSFEETDLMENISAMIRSVSAGKIRSVTLKSTMSPGIKIDYSGLS